MAISGVTWTDAVPQKKPVGLLSYLNTGQNTQSAPTVQTTTPATMGIRATSPSANLTPAPSTLPKSQVATNTSSPVSNSYSGSSSNANPGYKPDSLISTMGVAKTPQEMAAANNATTGAGSVDPTATIQTPAPTPTYAGILGQLVQSASKPSQQYTDQMAQANAYNEALNRSRMNEATGLAQNFQNPIPIEFQQGRGQVLENQYLQQQNALSNAYTGAANLVGAANTQQGLQQSALGTAAGYAQPQVTQYGQTSFNPVTGEFAGGGSLPSEVLSQYAQMAANGQYSAIPSFITSNPVLSAQLNTAARQINPNYNPVVSAAQAAATAANTQTAGTAGVQANQSVLNSAYNNYLQLQQTTQNIDQFGNLLTQTMQEGGINPSDVKFANAKLADIRNQLSSSQQAIYDNTLASLRSRVSGLLAAGGSEIPSQITSDATKILDGTLPVSALTGVLQRIQQEGNILLNNAANVVNTAYQGTQGSQGTQSTGSQGGDLTWANI